jgi:hypothetical protein
MLKFELRMKRLALMFCMVAGSAALGVYLFTAPACACESLFPKRIYFLATLTPLRDRAPELAAQRFLRDQGQGKCQPEGSDLCRYALTSRPVLDSRLVASVETKTGVILYYRVKAEEGREQFWGEAAVGVDHKTEGWKVTNYDAVY